MTGAQEVAILRRIAELEAIRAEWLDLWRRAPGTPFQSPDWLIPWWRRFGRGDLRVTVWRRQGRLVALAPLFIEHRIIRPIGVGITDHLGMLCEPAVADAIAARLIAELDRRDLGWTACEWPDLPAGSLLLAAALPEGWRELGWQDRLTADESGPVLRLPGTAEDLPRVLPALRRRKLALARRRAARRGAVTMEAAGPENFDRLFAALLDLHGARWASRGGPGVLAEAAVQSFHREAASGFMAEGVLRLYALRIGDCIAGVYYGFVQGNRAYAYLGGFDPRFAPESPGALTIFHAMEQAVSEGVGEFDFLRGREPYKYAWGAEDRPLWSRRILRGAGV
jgi:CelD/BcsL family acetyltransferase involved in cellulose biosynthesis